MKILEGRVDGMRSRGAQRRKWTDGIKDITAGAHNHMWKYFVARKKLCIASNAVALFL